jgi:hypothetical protein
MKTSKATLALLTALLLPASIAAQGLVMSYDGAALRVEAGEAYQPCAILVGLEKNSYALPGGATLDIEPLLMLSLGKFNEHGEYEFDLLPLLETVTEPFEPFMIHIQAISIDAGSVFQTSNSITLEVMTDRAQGPRVQIVDADGDDNHDDSGDAGTERDQRAGNEGDEGDEDGDDNDADRDADRGTAGTERDQSAGNEGDKGDEGDEDDAPVATKPVDAGQVATAPVH